MEDAERGVMQGQLGFANLPESKGKHLGSCWQLICAYVLASSAILGSNSDGEWMKENKLGNKQM